jgi:hypothetical protein
VSLYLFLYFVYRLVRPFCTEVLRWLTDVCIFVCKHYDVTVDRYIYIYIYIYIYEYTFWDLCDVYMCFANVFDDV